MVLLLLTQGGSFRGLLTIHLVSESEFSVLDRGSGMRSREIFRRLRFRLRLRVKCAGSDGSGSGSVSAYSKQ